MELQPHRRHKRLLQTAVEREMEFPKGVLKVRRIRTEHGAILTPQIQWDGPKQYQDLASKSLMMLPTDMALIQDKEFKKHVDRYAKDNDVFFQDFRDVLVKLLELGVPFQSKPEDRMELKPTS